MKRAILRAASIDLCLEHELFVTPISPAALPFSPDEEMAVALPRTDAGALGVGEYQFLFVMGEYMGPRPDDAERIFGRPSWQHMYRVNFARELEPFSLDDLVVAAGPDGDAVRELYRGQTQHHRIVKQVAEQHEPLFRQFFAPRGTAPAWSAAVVVESARRRVTRKKAATQSRAQIVNALKRMDRQNKRLAAGRVYRPGQTQRRNRRFTEYLKALYDDRCQVCGERVEGLNGARAEVHHLTPWDGDRSDRLTNVICLCPNDHARFELGALRYNMPGGLEEWSPDAGWTARQFSLNDHLFKKLK